MNRFATLLAAAAVCTFAAHAEMGVKAADLPHITNGSTGFIGVTESAWKTDRMGAAPAATTTTRADTPPSMSQEARPDEPMLRTPGGAPAPSDPRMHRAWGTPD